MKLLRKRGSLIFISLLVAILLVGCGGDDKKNSEKNSEQQSQMSTDSETQSENLTEDETDSETEKGTETEIETETETEMETETEKNSEGTTTPSTENNGDANTDNTQQTTPNAPAAPTTPGDTSGLIGSGTAADPYVLKPSVAGDGLEMTTIAIPAGGSVYYNVQLIGGMILTIDNSNAYVVCDGVKHEASGGAVSFQVKAAMATEYVTLEFGNKGGAAAAFKVSYANAGGSYMNPTVVGSINSWSISLEEGNTTGHYYKYVATKSGTIRFYMTDVAESDLIVTNNRSMAQRSFSGDYKTDEQGNAYIEVAVESGDELMIQATAIPTRRGKYPAVHITWYGEYR